MVLLAVAGGCRTIGGKKTEVAGVEAAETNPSKPDAGAPMILPVGVVDHVDEVARFVLIRSSKGLQLEPDTILTVHGNQGQSVSRVKVSPARKGAFLTADFIEGLPAKGQQVTMEYQRTAPGAATTSSTPGILDPNAVQVLE